MPEQVLEFLARQCQLGDDAVRSFCKWLGQEIAEHLRTIQRAETTKNTDDSSRSRLHAVADLRGTEPELILNQLRKFKMEAITSEAIGDDPSRPEKLIADLKLRYQEISRRAALPLKLFVSYSHSDEKLRARLATHLVPLEREELIIVWHDHKIEAGVHWEEMIRERLNAADLILLLVSSSFVASSYCYDIEVKRALARDKAGEARVIPVILRPAEWRGLPFGKLQALPRDGKPVTSWGRRSDEAFLEIVQGIRGAAAELLRLREEKRIVALDEAISLPK